MKKKLKIQKVGKYYIYNSVFLGCNKEQIISKVIELFSEEGYRIIILKVKKTLFGNLIVTIFKRELTFIEKKPVIKTVYPDKKYNFNEVFYKLPSNE